MKNKRITAVFVLAILFIFTFFSYDIPSPVHATGPRWLFVVVGQSNAVLMCNPGTILAQTEAAQYFPNLPDSIAAYYSNVDTLTICAAVSGSDIASWQPDATGPTTPTPTANNFHAAVNQVLTAKANGYIVKAIIFSQGEADASGWNNTVAPDYWTVQAANFLDAFRVAIGDQYVPVIYTELGDKPDYRPAGTPSPNGNNTNPYANWETIRKSQHELRYNRANFFMVDKQPFDAYRSGAPWVHNTPVSLQAIKDQIMIYLRGWVPKP